MDSAHEGKKLNVHPGEWYFGAEYENLYTVLGSCVTLSAWHPELRLGGLCHYLLPIRPTHLRDKGGEGRYGQTALVLMKNAMLHYAPLSEYQLGLFGGCDSFPNIVPHQDIGVQNVKFAQSWLHDERLKLVHMDVGGTSSRSLVMEIATGAIHVKHYPM